MQPGAGWIDDDDPGPVRVGRMLPEKIPHLTADEVAIANAVQLGVLLGHRHRLRYELDAGDPSRPSRQEERDRARSGVEIERFVSRFDGRRGDDFLEQALYLVRVRLKERVGCDAKP